MRPCIQSRHMTGPTSVMLFQHALSTFLWCAQWVIAEALGKCSIKVVMGSDLWSQQLLFLPFHTCMAGDVTMGLGIRSQLHPLAVAGGAQVHDPPVPAGSKPRGPVFPWLRAPVSWSVLPALGANWSLEGILCVPEAGSNHIFNLRYNENQPQSYYTFFVITWWLFLCFITSLIAWICGQITA